MFTKDKKSIALGFDEVHFINKYEYEDFDYLRYIYLHKGIIGLGRQTFRYCRSLNKIDVDDNNKVFSSVDGVLFDKNRTVLICYPASRAGISYKVPDTVRKIDDFAFSSASSLRKIELNEGLLEIGDCAFEGCQHLESLSLPESLEHIGHVAFQGCEKLKKIRIPEHLESITFPCFSDKSEEISVDPQNTVFTVCDGILFNREMSSLLFCPSSITLDEYFVPETVRRIEGSAFINSNIKKIVLSKQTTSVGNFAFAYLSEDSIIRYPKENKDLLHKDSAFSLTKITEETY